MKVTNIMVAGIAASLVVAVFGVYHMISDKKEVNSPGAGGKGNSLLGKAVKYESYETEVGDYRISFDFESGMEASDPMNVGDIISQDFFSKKMNFITITYVPAKYNVDENKPRDAAAYEAYDKTLVYGDMSFDEVDASDYHTGDWGGFAYHDYTEYEYGLSSYRMGYDMFCGDEYIYIFAIRSDGMPPDIKNLKIEKIH